MARFKLPIFAVVVVLLALLFVVYLGGQLSTLAGVQTTERLAWGQLLFETSHRLGNTYRTSAVAAAASDQSMAEVAASIKDAAPAATVADPVRKAVGVAFEKLPPTLRRASFFLVGNEKGVAVVPVSGGAAELRTDPNSFRLTDAVAAPPQGTFALVDGKLYAVAGAPLRLANSDKVVGSLGAAFPIDDTFAAEMSKDLAIPVTVVAGGNVLASSLPSAQRAAVGAAKDGPIAPISAAPSMGPFFAGGAALAQAKSFAIEGSSAGPTGARVVIVSEAALLTSLADSQRRVVFGILAVLAAALAFFFFGGRSEAAELPQPKPVAEVPAPPPATAPAQTLPTAADQAAQNEAAEAAFSAFRQSTGAPPPLPEPAPTAPPAPEPAVASAPPPPPAAPWDQPQQPPAQPEPAAPFAPFVPPPSAAELAEAAGASDPTAMVSNPYEGPGQPAGVPPPHPMMASLEFQPAAAPPPPPPMAEKPFDPFADQATESTVASPIPEDLLRQSARQTYSEPTAAQPESTVVAQIPEELLRAARAHLARTAPGAVPAAPPPPAAPAMTPEEVHFHEVFDQFVATRAQCNEAADGLTFDKFAAKLRKNRDQLVVKYNCRAVRFQVYVKDGKAALKATPVRE